MKGAHIHPASINALRRTWPGVALLLLLSAMRVFGATITVTNTNDDGSAGSLRAAVASAMNGDTINFNLAYPATILLSSPLTLGPSVTITGPGASNLAISGGDSVAVLIVNAGATVAISGVTIEHGSSLLGGGIFNGGTLALTNCVVSNNTVGNQLGGGIFNSGTLSLSTSTVSGNKVGGVSGGGGGIYNYLGTVNLTNSMVGANTAGLPGNGVGGGIYNDHGTLTLTNSSVSNNFADGDGGIFSDTGNLTMAGSTVSGNLDFFDAGGINIFGGVGETVTVSIVNSTISGNSCGSVIQPSCNGAGGIRATGKVEGAGLGNINMTLSNSTLSGNSCISEFGAGVGCDNLVVFLPTGSSLVLKNTILANSGLAPNCANGGGGLPPTSEGYNLSDDDSCSSFLTQTGDLNNTPAGLDPGGVKNNGGPTQTVALLAASPAVNAIPLSSCTDASGNPVTTDQRGVPRPQGSACDIGAFEYFQSNFVVATVQTFLLMAQVQSSPLPKIAQQVLTVPLQVAVDSLKRGNVPLAVVELGAFIILVDAARLSGELSQDQAAALTTPARGIIQSLRS